VDIRAVDIRVADIHIVDRRSHGAIAWIMWRLRVSTRRFRQRARYAACFIRFENLEHEHTESDRWASRNPEHAMKIRKDVAVIVPCFAVAIAVPGCSEPRDEIARTEAALTQQSIAVPSYFTDWGPMLQKAPPTRLVVMNPNSGPGSGYASQLAAAHAAGAKVIGYVYTQYGARNPSTVQADVDSYYSLYPSIDGIFFDQAWNRCDRVGYYQSLYDYIKTNKSASATVVTNQGTATESCYLSASDILITFESDYSTYVSNFGTTFREWETAANSGRIWHLVHTADTTGQMLDALDKSRQRQAGYVYVTQLHLVPNPWAAVASYYVAEADNVTTWNAGQGGGSGTFSRLRASNDAANAFYSVHFSGSDTFHRAYIDTDENAGTGFGHCTLGADYMVEDATGTSTVYAYTGDGISWSWAPVCPVGVTLGSGSILWTVDRTFTAETAYPNGADVCFESETSGNPIQTSAKIHHAYSNESEPIHAYFGENDGSSVFYQAAFDVSYAQKHVFIDTDQNAASGYPVGGIGADYMLENGTAYHYTGVVPAWGWTSIGASNMSPATAGATGATSWSIARSLIGETAPSGEASNLVFHGRTTAGVEFTTSPIYVHNFTN
jgi:hypothetical protein